MGRGVCDGDVGADVVKTDSSSEGTVYEEISTTEVVDEEKEPDECDDCFDYTEDTSGEERAVCTDDTDFLENSWGVIVDGVDSGCVLPEEERATEGETIHDFAVVGESFEWLPETKSDGGMLFFESGIDAGYFFEHVNIVLRELSDPAKVFESGGPITAAHKPSRRFSNEEESGEHEPSGNQLDGKWDDPLFAICWHSSGNSVLFGC